MRWYEGRELTQFQRNRFIFIHKVIERLAGIENQYYVQIGKYIMVPIIAQQIYPSIQYFENVVNQTHSKNPYLPEPYQNTLFPQNGVFLITERQENLLINNRDKHYLFVQQVERDDVPNGFDPALKDCVPFFIYSSTAQLRVVYKPEVLKYGRSYILTKLTIPTLPDVHVFWCPVAKSAAIDGTVVRLKYTPRTKPENTW